MFAVHFSGAIVNPFNTDEAIFSDTICHLGNVQSTPCAWLW